MLGTPAMWQAEADIELTLSASPATGVGELTLTMANWRYSTVFSAQNLPMYAPPYFDELQEHTLNNF